MVSIKASSWHLVAHCPVCEQGDCLLLCTCPRCSRLLVMCEEDDTVFPDPRDLALTFTISTACPFCGGAELKAFAPADWKEIQHAGFEPGEYI